MRKSREEKRKERAERHDPGSSSYVGDVSPGSVGGEARSRGGWTQDPVTGKVTQLPLEEGKITITVKGTARPPEYITTERISKIELAPTADVGFGKKVLAGATAFMLKPYEATEFVTGKAVKGVQAVSRRIGIGETSPFKEKKMLEAERKVEAFELEQKRFDINVQRITTGLISAKGFGQVERIKGRYPGVKFEEVKMPGMFEEGKFVYKPYTQLRITSPKLEAQFMDVQKTFKEAGIKDPSQKFIRGVKGGIVLSAVTVPVLIAGIKYQPFKTGKEMITTAVKHPVYTAGTLIGVGILTKGVGKVWGKVRPVKLDTKVFTPAKTGFVSRVDVRGFAVTKVKTVTRYKQQVMVAGKPFRDPSYYKTQRTFDITSKGKVLGDFETGIVFKKGKGVKQELILTPKETGIPLSFKFTRAQLGKFQAFARQKDVMLYEYGLKGITKPSPVPKAQLVGKGYGLVFGKEATIRDFSVWQKGVGVVKETTGKPARAFSLGMGKAVIKTKVPVGIKKTYVRGITPEQAIFREVKKGKLLYQKAPSRWFGEGGEKIGEPITAGEYYTPKRMRGFFKHKLLTVEPKGAGITTRWGLWGKGLREAQAHELIHYKTVPFLKKILPKKIERVISEKIAYGLETRIKFFEVGKKVERVYTPKTFRRTTIGAGRMEQVKVFDPETGKLVFDLGRKGKVFKLWKEKGVVTVLRKSKFEPKMAVSEGRVLTEEYPYGMRPGAVERLDLDVGFPSGGVSPKFDVSSFKAIGTIRSQFEGIGQISKRAVISYTDVVVAPLAITGRESKRISVSQMAGASLAKTLQLPKTKVVQRLGVSQRLGVFTFQIPAVAVATATRTRTALKMQLGLKAVTTPTPSVVPSITVPGTGTPTGKFPFFIGLGDDRMKKGIVGKISFKQPKFKPRYDPSVEAKYFKIKGKKPKRITGLELRPIIKI